MRQRIPVVMAFDQGYAFPTFVTVSTVMEHADPEKQYMFHFLTLREEAAAADRGFFQAMEGRYPNFSWEFVYVAPEMFENAECTISYISTTTYYRLLIAELLPEYDRCIYLDADLIVFDDIARVLAVCDESRSPSFDRCYLAAVRDLMMQMEEADWTKPYIELLGLKSARSYFNAGVLVLNLALLRRDHMASRFLKHLERNYYFADQDILNCACEGRVLYLPLRYNLIAPHIRNRHMAEIACRNEEDRRDMVEGRPVVCHFAGPDKPWNLIETIWENHWYEAALRMPRTAFVEEQLAACAQKRLCGFCEDLYPELFHAPELVLYGFTPSAQKLCDRLLADGAANIRCFCDRDPEKTGQSHAGIACRTPEVLRELDPDARIIICPQRSWQRIYGDLVEGGVDPARLLRYRSRDFMILDPE